MTRQPEVAALGTRFYAQRFPVLPAKLPNKRYQVRREYRACGSGDARAIFASQIGRLGRFVTWERTWTAEVLSTSATGQSPKALATSATEQPLKVLATSATKQPLKVLANSATGQPPEFEANSTTARFPRYPTRADGLRFSPEPASFRKTWQLGSISTIVS